MRITELTKIIKSQLESSDKTPNEFQQGYDAALEDILTIITLHTK